MGRRLLFLLFTSSFLLCAPSGHADAIRIFDKFSKLLDVNVSSPTTGQVPMFNSVSGKWENADLPPAASGSNLSRTVWVDLNGDDGTAVIGDITKPYRTVVASVTALETAASYLPATVRLGQGIPGPISPENITTELPGLTFIGPGVFDSLAFTSLTATRESFFLYLTDCVAGAVFVSTNFSPFLLGMVNGEILTDVTNDGDAGGGGGGIEIKSDVGHGLIDGSVTATGAITVTKTDRGTYSTPGNITATGSFLAGVSNCDILTLTDSRVQGGTANANSVIYSDNILKGIAPGGTTDQVLAKASNSDFDTEWVDANAGVSSVTGTAPIASSGGATPDISISAATTSAAGSMSAADKTKLDAISGTNTGDQVVPVNTTATSHQFFTAYNSTTGAFTKAQPAAGDVSGLGTLATQDGTFSGTSSGTNTGDQLVFKTIAISGQSDVVADTTTDTLTFAAGSNITLTTNASTDTVTIATSSVGTVTGEFDGAGSALSTGNTGIPWTAPYSGTISGWSISVDAGTATFKVWKKANGTAIPTVSDVINTSGVSISTGTHVRSSTVSDFTTTTVTAGDQFIFALTAVATATKAVLEVEITK